MAGRDERVCVRTMTDVPKVNVRKVPSNGEDDDVEQKLKKRIHVVQTERQCHTWNELLNQYNRNDPDVFGDGRGSFV